MKACFSFANSIVPDSNTHSMHFGTVFGNKSTHPLSKREITHACGSPQEALDCIHR